LIQTFDFSAENKKYLNYLFDARFLFKRKVDKLVSDFLLDGYISRIDEPNRITLKYRNQEKPKNCIRKLQAYIPPYFGCLYCCKAEIKGEFIYCPEKSKHYTLVSEGIKRCPVFRSKDKIIT
jgi:hypothetical protein